MTTGRRAEDGQTPGKSEPAPDEVSPLIAGLLEDQPRTTVRQPLSAAEMAALREEYALHSLQGKVEQRRRAILAAGSPLLGAAAFLLRRAGTTNGNGDPTDPLALLQALESRSPSVEAAIASGRPTLIEFYGPRCPNCKAMAPDVALLERRLKGKVVHFLLLLSRVRW